MAKRKRKKSQPKAVPTVVSGYSGVRSGELEKLKRWLRKNGAKNIQVERDYDTDREFTDDTHFIVDYAR